MFTKWLHFPNYLCQNHKRSGDELTAIWLWKSNIEETSLSWSVGSSFSVQTYLESSSFVNKNSANTKISA
jgi:hypothetical protein